MPLSKPTATDIRLHEALSGDGGGVRRGGAGLPLTDITMQRNVTSNAYATIGGGGGAAAKSSLLGSGVASSSLSGPYCTGGGGGSSSSYGAFSLAQYRHDSLDVKAEVDRMYQNILKSLEGNAVDPHHQRDNGGNGNGQHNHCAASTPMACTSEAGVNFAASASPYPMGGVPSSGNDYFDFMRPTPSSSVMRHGSSSSPNTPRFISATTDSRVAAMQALLRQNKQYGGGPSTSGLYRSNTFGSGRKGMSEPVNKIDDGTPGPGSYHKDDTPRSHSHRASSAQRGGPEFGRPSSSVRARSASRTRSAERGVSFGRSERPPMALSDKEVHTSRREPAMRPPGPGDYVAPSTFAISKPTSTKGSFGKADRDAGQPKPIAPGPGSYATEKDDKALNAAKSGPSPAFASHSPRLPPVKSEAPGPGAYLVTANPTASSSTGFSFSKAPLPTLTDKSEITPGPGDYYIANEDPAKYMRGAIPTAGRDESTWGGKNDNPGPGAYTVKSEEKEGVSMKFRYREKVAEVPGPGYYNPDDQAKQNGPAWSLVGKGAEKPFEVTPGPGQYTDPTSTIAADNKGVSIGGAKRETPADIAAKENLPGPGFYETAQSALSAAGAVPFGNAKREHAFDKTTEAPGPGTYDIDVADAHVLKRAAVPTLHSNTERFPNADTTASPGPGYYMVSHTDEAVAGGAIDQAQRNASLWGTNATATGDIGPGAYENPITFNSGRAVSMSMPLKEAAADTNPNVGPGAYDTVDAMKALLPNPPSTAIGKENRFGVAPKDEAVPGPGAYEALDPETWLYEKTPAATFASSPRMPQEASSTTNTVGPGAYMFEHPTAIGANAVGGAIDGAARFPNEAAALERNGVVPGPGAYDVPAVGIDTQKAITIGGTGHKTMEVATASPGPGAYDVNTTTLADKGVSIGQAPQRMLHEAKDGDVVPGPGAYDVSRTAVDPHVPAPTFNGRNEERPSSGVGPGAYEPNYVHLPSAPAISMPGAERRFDIVSGKEVPGPGYYDPHAAGNEGNAAGRVGLLASGAPRFNEMPTNLNPGPGTYDPQAFHEAMEGKGAPMFSGPGHADMHTPASDAPGPGTYDPRLPASNGITIHATDKKTYPMPTSDAPGPGTYTIPSTISTANAPSFGVGSRGELYPVGSDTPGPGMYDPYAAMKLLHEASPAYSFSAAAKYGIPDSRALYPGPGAYHFERKELYGPSYSFGREERPTLHPVLSDAPGPGLYNAEVKSAAPAYSFPVAPRVVDAPNQDVPGPGAYETKVAPSGPFVTIGGQDKGHDVYLRGKDAAEVPGPGAYNISRQGVLAGDETAPAYSFGTAVKKDPVPADQPGPGHYNPLLYAEGPFYSIAGKYSNALEPRPDGPGPGAYDVSATLDTNHGISVPQAMRFPPSNSENTPGPGAYLSAEGRREGPMISFSSATRMSADPTTDAPGPGMYDQTLPPQGPWYSIAGKRPGTAAPNDSPGPGAYDSELPADGRGAVMLGAPRFEKDPTSDVPGPGMYALGQQWNDGRAAVFPTAEKPADKELREAAAMPGPGAYSTSLAPQGPFYSMMGKYRDEAIANAFVPGPGAYVVGDLSKGPSAFIGNAPRVQPDGTEANPGPGAYVLPSALSPLGVTFGVAQRLPDARSDDTPGPGLYDAGGPGMFDGPKYSFPLASNRPSPATDVPGPGMYNAAPGKEMTMAHDAVYSFGRADRMPADKPSSDNAGPGAYNLGEAPHAGPAYSIGQAGPFGRGNGVPDTPGPGSYAPANLWNKEGPAIQGKWREGGGPSAPGPGAYRVHDFDPYARDMATVIDFSKGGERIVNAPIKTVTSAGPGAYYRHEHYVGTKQFRFLERFPEPFVEPTPGPPDYHTPNVENPFYDPLAR